MTSLMLASVLVLSGTSKAQTTTIDYGNSPNVTCGSLGTGTPITGIYHKSTVGYQNLTSSKLWMYGYQTNGSQYEITQDFMYGHTYRITVEGQSASIDFNNYGTSSNARIELAMVSPWVSTACDFTGTVPAASGNYVGNMTFPYNSYATASFDFTMTGYRNVLKVSFPGSTGVMVNNLWLRKIVIKDISVNPPTFNLTATTETKQCGEEKQVTYTIENINNTAGVTGYKFQLVGGDWLFPNGTPAPSIINSPTNTITLVSGPCASTATIKGNALIGQMHIPTNNKILTTATPLAIITGPGSLYPNQSGFYQAAPAAGFPVNYNWDCQVSPRFTWSTNYPNETTLYNTTPLNTNFSAYASFLASDPWGRTVQLKAATTMCGVNVEVTKDIKIVPVIKPLNGTAESNLFLANVQELSVYPNPTSNIVTIELGYSKEGSKLELYSIEGKLLHHLTINGTQATVDLTKYPAGVYYFKVMQNDKIQVKSIIKN